MRWLLIVLVWLPAVALAKPKVAVAPLDGDDDSRYADAVAEEAAAHAKVTGPKPTAKAADALGLSDPNTPRSLKKLRNKLEVDAIIHGKVEKSGGKKKLVLEVSGRGKRGSAFELETKSATSKSFRKELREELAKRIAPASEGEAKEDADEEDKPAAKPAKRVASDDDSTRVRKHSDDDDDSHAHKKKKHHHEDDDTEEPPPPRHPTTQAALILAAGPAGLHRTLTYDTTGVTPPPAVGTASLSGQIEGEVYPGAFDTLKGPGAGFGVFGSVGKTVGLSITVPGTNASAPIDEMHYQIGARYRFAVGQATYAFGVSYWARKFSADRTNLMGANLDMPDVFYKGVAPGAIAKFAASPTIGIGLQVDVPLMMASGEITDGMTGFGQASIISVAAEGTVDVALAPHYGLRFAALFDQVGLSFQSPQRGVTGATDRSMGVTATFALLY